MARHLQIISCLLLSTTLLLAAPTTHRPGLKSLNSGHFYDGFNCTVCVMGVKLVETLSHWGLSEKTIAKAALGLCDTFHLEDRPVCQGAVNEFKDEVVAVLKSTKLPAKDTCALLFGDVCASASTDHEVEWRVPFPDVPKPENTPPRRPKPNAPKMRILHLSDIHLDRYYRPGSTADCGEPLCCRQGNPSRPTDGAGHWGDYRNCDIPEYTLDSMFSNIAKREKFDVIYWTGDLPPHNIWDQSRESQTSLLQHLTDKLQTYFPGKPIYSALGNHESAPVNSFPPPFVKGNDSESWLYKVLAKTWSPWLPQDAQQTIVYGAFYTALVRPGFRVISINTNYCNRLNWWLLLNTTDPAQELKWLVDILQNSENMKEKVHVIGHIPPGESDCYRVWSENFHNIVVRYSNTIAAQFYGHTHKDHYEIFYDPMTHEPVSVAYIAPSVTTYSNLNPGYRIYTADGIYTNSSWIVMDHETRIMNLTHANTYNKTIWSTEYSAKFAYNMTDLLPQSWHKVSREFATNDKLFAKFYKYYFKMADQPTPCDKSCRDAIICSLHMATFGSRQYCHQNTLTSTTDIHQHMEKHRVC